MNLIGSLDLTTVSKQLTDCSEFGASLAEIIAQPQPALQLLCRCFEVAQTSLPSAMTVVRFIEKHHVINELLMQLEPVSPKWATIFTPSGHELIPDVPDLLARMKKQISFALLSIRLDILHSEERLCAPLRTGNIAWVVDHLDEYAAALHILYEPIQQWHFALRLLVNHADNPTMMPDALFMAIIRVHADKLDLAENRAWRTRLRVAALEKRCPVASYRFILSDTSTTRVAVKKIEAAPRSETVKKIEAAPRSEAKPRDEAASGSASNPRHSFPYWEIPLLDPTNQSISEDEWCRIEVLTISMSAADWQTCIRHAGRDSVLQKRLLAFWFKNFGRFMGYQLGTRYGPLLRQFVDLIKLHTEWCRPLIVSHRDRIAARARKSSSAPWGEILELGGCLEI